MPTRIETQGQLDGSVIRPDSDFLSRHCFNDPWHTIDVNLAVVELALGVPVLVCPLVLKMLCNDRVRNCQPVRGGPTDQQFPFRSLFQLRELPLPPHHLQVAMGPQLRSNLQLRCMYVDLDWRHERAR